MSKRKVVIIEKDGVQAEADQVSLAGLLKHGWTVVDDGDDKETVKRAEAKPAKAEDVQEQESKVFGSNDKE